MFEPIQADYRSALQSVCFVLPDTLVHLEGRGDVVTVSAKKPASAIASSIASLVPEPMLKCAERTASPISTILWT